MNTAWQITEVPNFAKQKVGKLKTKPQLYICSEPHFDTIWHFLVLCGFFVNTYIYCRRWNSDFCISTWTFIMATRARQTTVPSAPLIKDIVERAERLDTFQNQWEGLQRHLLLTIFFMQSFCSSRRHSTWGISFGV